MALAQFIRKLSTPGMRKWYYNACGYNQYGLMFNDIYDEFDPDVQEALRRLPEDVRNARNFRIVRAMTLDMQKKILPEEEWTKFEEDKKYLDPYLEEVIKEREEKEKWDAEG